MSILSPLSLLDKIIYRNKLLRPFGDIATLPASVGSTATLAALIESSPQALAYPLSLGCRWNSCKQNKQGANSRPVNQTPPPEGEKLHSDSGISVDSQSLHDQQTHTQTASGQGE